MLETELELSNYNQDDSFINTESFSLLEDTLYLGEESQMDGFTLELTSSFSFFPKEKIEELDYDWKKEKKVSYSTLQIFTITCYISSFLIASIGLIFLFLQR